jgi:uncharacterized protein (DUF433 family)
VRVLQKAKVNHGYIEKDPRVCAGSPVIKGTRVRVVDVAIEYECLDRTPDEIVMAHPHLELKQVHDALSYYYGNRVELDQKIKKDRQFVKELSKRMGER